MKKMKMTKWLWLALLAAQAVALTACSGGAGATPQATEAPPVAAPASVTADGKVVPVKTANLSFTTSAKVAEVLVTEGQTVRAGDVIARLSGADQRQANVAAAELELLTAQQALDQLNQNAELARAQAQLKVAEAAKELDKASKRRISRDYHVGDQDAIDLAWADYIRAQHAVEDMERTWEYFKNRDPQDVNRAEVLAQLARVRQTRDTALANYNYLRSKPDQLEVDEAEAQLQLARAALASAQAELEKVKNGPDPDALALATARVHNARAQLAAARASLDELSLVAPFDGTVVSNPLKVGEPVSPGAPAVILADLSRWRIETIDLTELNVVDLKVGDRVQVTVDALPDLTLTGSIASIDLLGQNRQGDIVYTVRVDLNQQDPRLMWNMTASVTFED
jgi:HlyD family secretion protein